MMYNDRFIYKKMQFLEKDVTGYFWYLIHKETRNGVHFHGQQYNENYEYGDFCPWDDFENGRNHYRFAAHGIELHSTKPMYKGHKKLEYPCDVTCGDCYCDGTSLMASRSLGFINPDGQHDIMIWNVLHDWYDNNFKEYETEQRQALEE